MYARRLEIAGGSDELGGGAKCCTLGNGNA
jgi:hypothetical protein